MAASGVGASRVGASDVDASDVDADDLDASDVDADQGHLWMLSTVAQCIVTLDDSLCQHAPEGTSDAAKTACTEQCRFAVTRGIQADDERAVVDCMDRVLTGDAGARPECRFQPTNRVLEGRRARCLAECREWIARTRRPPPRTAAPSATTAPAAPPFMLPPPPPPPPPR